ncbi:hypothetical protein FGO68_gene8383 [Halteria grandinella]|uniref:Uncharacterized protein n=1 Tax=Halteria grandinella TaxID=5974 RepID=A0A8J8NKC2_HALGN|nr:hypothetical protein FGO68_gene8383 [Halteria grandinella]
MKIYQDLRINYCSSPSRPCFSKVFSHQWCFPILSAVINEPLPFIVFLYSSVIPLIMVTVLSILAPSWNASSQALTMMLRYPQSVYWQNQ